MRFGVSQRGDAGKKARLPLSARRYCAGERPIGKGHSPHSKKRAASSPPARGSRPFSDSFYRPDLANRVKFSGQNESAGRVAVFAKQTRWSDQDVLPLTPLLPVD